MTKKSKHQIWYEEQQRKFLEKQKEVEAALWFRPDEKENGGVVFNKSVVQQIEESTEFTPMDTNITMEEFNSFLDDLAKPRKIKYGESEVTFIPNPQFDEPKAKKARTEKGHP